MDTKSRNIKYAYVTKVVAVLLVWVCAMGMFSGGIYMLMSNHDAGSKDYYDNYSFNQEYSTYIYDLVELNVKYRSETATISGASGEVLSEDAKRYQELQDKIMGSKNFVYYIKNQQTGDVISNVNANDRIAVLEKLPTYMHLNGTYYSKLIYQKDVTEMLKNTPFDVHVAVNDPLKPGDALYDEYMNFTQTRGTFNLVAGGVILAAVLMLTALIYLILVTGQSEPKGAVRIHGVDRIYTDVHTLGVLLAAILSVALVQMTGSYTLSLTMIAVGTIFAIDVVIGISYVLSMARQVKSGQIFRNSLLVKLYTMVKELTAMAFRGKLFRTGTVVFLLGYGFADGVLFYIFITMLRTRSLMGFLVSGTILFCFNMVAVYYVAKALMSLTEIMEAVKKTSEGNLNYMLDPAKISPAFADFNKDIQSIQMGLKKAVEEAVKGERMKTELITNVSHDLKTPLTSIINYVDLLKGEDLQNEKAEEYVLVLEEKSGRLKQLIEDLIEASKASSGNLNVSTEKVDLNQLLMQAYGEYEEKMEAAGLDIRIHAAEKNILVDADGKYLWRVVENLLSNALKYSMPQSRVYINLEKDELVGRLTIKNISAFPLNISPAQLTERFVRGDVSRTTEGSGLGLSIAQGLTSLQKGSFHIDIDGDLFKVTIEIPLWNEE